MTTLAITVNVSNPDVEDRQTMEFYIKEENTRRAALDPPGIPLPFATAPERKASYEVLLNQAAADMHTHRVNQAKMELSAATPREVKVSYALAAPNIQSQVRTLLGL